MDIVLMEKEKLLNRIEEAKLLMEFVSYLDGRGCWIRDKYGFAPSPVDLVCQFIDIDKEKLLEELNDENHESV